MQSNFHIISEMGNFRFQVQCLKCGHDFTHRSGQENSFSISDTKTSPLCPICGAKDEDLSEPEQNVTSNKAALASFGITLAENQTPNEEPWEVYDDSKRRLMSRRQDECVAEGKRWIEQDIGSNRYDGNLTETQIAAIKFLFPVKGSDLLAFCRAH